MDKFNVLVGISTILGTIFGGMSLIKTVRIIKKVLKINIYVKIIVKKTSTYEK